MIVTVILEDALVVLVEFYDLVVGFLDPKETGSVVVLVFVPVVGYTSTLVTMLI